MPGDYTNLMLLAGASPETIAQFKETWGLNDPIYVQYWRFITNLVTLDAGTSIQFRIPVWDYVQMKIFNTLILVGPAITVAYIIGTIFGTIAGANRGSKLEKYGLLPAVFVGTFPSFFIAIVLVIVFAGWLNWFPTSGMTSATFGRTPDAAWWRPYLTKNFLRHYTLPFTAIILRYTYLPSLIVRTNVIEVMGQDFINYHRITGMPQGKIFRNIGRHAILPVVTLYPISLARAISGLVLIEVVFNWPGIGFALVQAVLSRDLPVIQFVFAVIAVFIILANFFIDLLYGVIDPRISVES
jgi:peptide/nickel transport system permease protein